MEKARPIEKQDFLNRLYDTFANLTIFLSVMAFFIALAPIIYVGFVMVYFLIAIILSVFLVLFTIGLIFTVENNIVTRIWSSLDQLDVNKAVSFQASIGPVLLGFIGVLLVLLIVGLVLKMNKTKTKPIATIVVGGVAFILLFVFLLMGGGVK